MSFRLPCRTILFFLLAAAVIFKSDEATAQTRTIDSLQRLLTKTSDSKSQLEILMLLTKRVGKNEPLKGISYAYRAMHLADGKDHLREACELRNLLGGLYYSAGNYDSSMLFHRRALKMAGDRFLQEVPQADVGLAQDFIIKGGYDSAEYFLTQALSISLKLNDRLSEAGIYNCWGNLDLERNKLDQALKYFIMAADLYETMPLQRDGLSKALVNIGNVENILGHFENALEYARRSGDIFKENHDVVNLAYCYKLMGRIYRRQADFPKALVAYQDAITIYRDAGLKHDMSETYHGIGNIYYDMKNFKAALREYLESLRIASEISDENQMAYVYTAVAYAYYQLKEPRRSVSYFDSAIQKARQVHNRYLVMDSYQTLADINEEQNNDKAALKYVKAYSVLKDSLSEEDNRKVVEETEARFQNTQKQSEIELLRKDQLLKKTEIRQNRILLYSLIVGVILLIVIGTLLFNRYRLITDSRRHQEIEKVRQHIGRDLHDDIGSTLSTIHIISDFAIHENIPSNAAKHFKQIGEQSGKMLETMADMVWSINPENDSIDNMLVRMREFCGEILESKNIEYQIIGEGTLADVTLSLEARKNIFLIFKEFVNNAAKYSGATNIKIVFSRSGQELNFTIQDNGKGFDENTSKPGNGLRNMRARAKDINAVFLLTSKAGLGTSLSVSLIT